MEEVNPFATSSNADEKEEAEYKAAETIPEMMKMTETAFDEAENIIASAETRLGEAWDHTQKILERHDVEESEEIDTGKNSLFDEKFSFVSLFKNNLVTGDNSSKNTSESFNTAFSEIREPDIGSIEDQILKSAQSSRARHSTDSVPCLTDSNFIEEQTRTSFTALFGDPVPPEPNRCSTFDHDVQD